MVMVSQSRTAAEPWRYNVLHFDSIFLQFSYPAVKAHDAPSVRVTGLEILAVGRAVDLDEAALLRSVVDISTDSVECMQKNKF